MRLSSNTYHTQKQLFPQLLDKYWAPPPLLTMARRRRRHVITTQQQNKQKQKKQKVVVIMGPTGSGKSRLSVDLATRFFANSEVINSDKIQLYSGLDITTNKTPLSDRLGVPHHLLGTFPPCSDVSPSLYRSAASAVISSLFSRRSLPILAGGSNSLIYSLLSNRFMPGCNIFDPTRNDDVCTELRYDCCFLWVHVAMPALDRYLIERVDEMLDSGMFDELTRYFREEGFGSGRVGIRMAIGVPEFEGYFRKYLFEEGDDRVRRGAYERAVGMIKDNTCQLARRQVGKIQRLRDCAGWELNRLDATASFEEAMGGDDVAARVCWERNVVEPSVKVVKQFLEE